MGSDFSPTRVLKSGMGLGGKKKKITRKCYVTVAVPASFIRKLLLGKLSLCLSLEHLVGNFSHSFFPEPSQKQEQEGCCRISLFFKICFEKKPLSMVKINPWSGSLVYDFTRLQSKIFLLFYLNAGFLLAAAQVPHWETAGSYFFQ